MPASAADGRFVLSQIAFYAAITLLVRAGRLAVAGRWVGVVAGGVGGLR